MAQNYTILLSVRSPIFAPLYLAKVRGNAFRNIDFKYGFELLDSSADGQRNGRQIDTLSQRVLSKAPENEKYIAGVADPFRCLMLQSDGAMYKAKILGSIIRHQTFWLASDDRDLHVGSADEALRNCAYIVAQPKYTSGYAVLTRFLCKLKGLLVDAITPGPMCDTIGSLGVYHNTLPGFERKHYEILRDKSCRQFNYAYLTTNPADHEQPIVQFSHKERGKEFRNTLMSALFCGNGLYCKYPMLFDDICHDIVRAIDAIQCDPVGAAIELKEYANISGDQYMNFANKYMRHRRLVEILDDLIRDDIYAPDLKLTQAQLKLGAEIRTEFKEAGKIKDTPASMFFKDFRGFIDNYFDTNCVVGGEPEPDMDEVAGKTADILGDRERTAGMPDFVRYSMRNYRQTIDRFYESSVVARSVARAPTLSLAEFPAWLRYHVPTGWRSLLYAILPAIWAPLGAVWGYRPAWQRYFGDLAMTGVYWPWFGPELFLTLVSFGPLVLAYVNRLTERGAPNLTYDMILTLTIFVNLSVVQWALLLLMDPRLLEKGETHMSASDQLSVELFLISIAIIIFGAVLLAARDRVVDIWNKLERQWVALTIIRTRIQPSPVPPLACGKRHRCWVCKPLDTARPAKAPAAGAQAGAVAGVGS